MEEGPKKRTHSISGGCIPAQAAWEVTDNAFAAAAVPDKNIECGQFMQEQPA
jgi:hypothetical protein